jgi:hypothetical protein
MVRRDFSEEVIWALVKDGWNFRVKVSKGRRYITRRKGQIERSLGPYSDELWGTIEKFRKEFREEGELSSIRIHEQQLRECKGLTVGGREDEYEQKLRRELDLWRSIYMMKNCSYKDDKGYCTFWARDTKPRLYEYAKELAIGEDIVFRKIGKGKEGKKKWVVRASTWFCKNCPSFSDVSLSRTS